MVSEVGTMDIHQSFVQKKPLWKLKRRPHAYELQFASVRYNGYLFIYLFIYLFSDSFNSSDCITAKYSISE
jgi:hypothetical protein